MVFFSYNTQLSNYNVKRVGFILWASECYTVYDAVYARKRREKSDKEGNSVNISDESTN